VNVGINGYLVTVILNLAFYSGTVNGLDQQPAAGLGSIAIAIGGLAGFHATGITPKLEKT
jgi:hypothetical protein